MAETNGAETADDIRSLLTAFHAERDPQLLTAAVAGVERLMAAPGFAELDGSTRAFVWTLGAAALTWRARTISAGSDDLDRAIEWTGRAVDAWPPDDLNLPRTQSNLAIALADRYDRDADPADLDRALRLFDVAIPRLRAAGVRVDIALHGQGMGLHERARGAAGTDVVDLDRAIALFRDALGCPEPDPDERAGYLNSLGLSLRRKGRALADPALLTEAADAYRSACEHAEPNGDNHVAAATNLAAVLQDRAEAENDVGLLREAIQVYRDVLPSVDERRHLRVTTNLATALIDLYRHSRDRAVLEDATRDLRHSAQGMPDGTSRLVVLANLGGALHEMFTHTGRIALLDEAIAVQDELLAPPNPRTPERTLNLGVSLLARFRRRRAQADLDRALGLFEETSAISTSRIERASALNSRANALSLRFDATRARADIDRCVRLRQAAVATAPPGSLDAAMYRGNLGVDLLKRFELTADERDLERAVDEQRRSVRDVPATSADQPSLLAGLADSLARLAMLTGDDRDVRSARSAYRQAVGIGRESLPEQALGAAMRWGAWESGQGCWADAAGAYETGLAAMTQLFGRQQLRADKESWLADAQGLPAAAGFAHVRAGRLDRAVIAIEHGRATLLAEALLQRRILASEWRLPYSFEDWQTRAVADQGIDAVRAARAELDAVIEEIRGVEGFEHFLTPPTFADIAATAAPSPLVYFAAADQGGLALVVRDEDVRHVPLNTLTADALRAKVEAHLQAYAAYRDNPTEGRKAWSDALSSVTSWLWDDAVGPVLAALDGAQEAVFVAGGLLGLLPLHAAWTQDLGTPTGRRYALDQLTISYAPNARALQSARELAATVTGRRLLSVVEPAPVSAPPLPFAPFEARGFAAGTGLIAEELPGPRATPLQFRKHASDSDVLHLTCHGRADLVEPLQSGLLLAMNRTVVLQELMEMRLRVRLAVLSACETALPGTDLPDEVIGLPTGLLQAGVAGVVASQWAVMDRATAMLITEFGRRWAMGALPPAMALQQAQQWLRDTTNRQKRDHWLAARHEEPTLPTDVVAEFMQATSFGGPDARDHGDLAAWAAFAHVGV